MQIEFSIGLTFGEFWAVTGILTTLFFGSILFNDEIDRRGTRAEGWTWLQVAVGVFYTQIAVGLLDLLLHWNAFFLGLLAYTVSGIPMIRGAWNRHQDAQTRAKKAIHEK